MESDESQFAQLMQEYGRGAPNAANELMKLFYPELRRVAAAQMKHERPDHSWQPTILLNELYLELRKIQNLRPADEQERARFLGFAAYLMKRLLVHHARRRSGWPERFTELQDEVVRYPGPSDDSLHVLESVLTRLANVDPKLRVLVEAKVFEGLTEPEIAARLGCSIRSVARYWQFARFWLQQELVKDT